MSKYLPAILCAQCLDRGCRTKPLPSLVWIVVKCGVEIQKQRDEEENNGGALGARCTQGIEQSGAAGEAGKSTG